MNDERVNILLVDDKPEKLLSLEAVLEDLGQNIVRAYSGREALRNLLTEEFAVILLDVNMPGMDGFETASLIRQRKSTQDVPIIFVTAYGDDDHRSRGYKLGAVDYIQTPIVPEVLKTKVAVFVDLFRKTEQVKRQAESLRYRASRLQKLAAASVAVNTAMSIDKLLQTITDSARDVIGTHQAITLFLADPYSGRRASRPRAVTSFSDKYQSWRGKELDLKEIANTVVAQSRVATRLTDDELRDHADWETVKSADIPPIRGGILAAPFTGRDGNNLGIIYLTDRHDGEFTNDDQAVLVQLAQMASIAIENTVFSEERETNRIKDEFLSTLSHELRTPLNAILGWTQLLRLEGVDGEVLHGLEVIERNAKAQTKLVEDLLDVSRVTTGKLRVSTKPVNLAKIVESVTEAMRPNAEAKQIGLHFSCAAADGMTMGDADRLQQVAWNLLSNAVKFTPAGGRIDVVLDRINAQLRLRVTDTGLGIQSSFLPYVFDRFRQADSTSTRTHGGLGIGLTIVRHIIQLHGGSVHAESGGEGQGSTFTVLLPAIQIAPITEVVVPASPEIPQSPPQISLRGISVLIVDDEPDAREVVATILMRAGADVLTAESVAHAMKCLAQAQPHVIVSDIAMPDEDGYDLVRRLRDLPTEASRLPAIAMTAYVREEDRARALASGFQFHLPKPIIPDELLLAVQRFAQQGRAHHPAAMDSIIK